MRRVVWSSALLLTTSCGLDAFTSAEPFRPELTAFSTSNRRQTAGGLIVIRTQLVDTGVRLADRHRVLVTVTTSRGDEENVELERDVCPGTTTCAGFIVGFNRQDDLALLNDVFEQSPSVPPQTPGMRFPERQGKLPGRLDWALLSGNLTFAVGYVWRNRDKARVFEAIRAIPGIRYVEPDGYGCFETCPPFHTWLSAARPIDDRRIARRNGWIEARAGDTITISYAQPSGATLTRSVVVRTQ